MSSIPCQAKIKWITFENAKDSSHSMGEDQRNQTDGCEEHGAKREDQNNPGTIRNKTSHDRRNGKTPFQTVGGFSVNTLLPLTLTYSQSSHIALSPVHRIFVELLSHLKISYSP